MRAGRRHIQLAHPAGKVDVMATIWRECWRWLRGFMDGHMMGMTEGATAQAISLWAPDDDASNSRNASTRSLGKADVTATIPRECWP
ncbi:hypothetical protein AB1N83_012535 [Pleurotus pulmonarius]